VNVLVGMPPPLATTGLPVFSVSQSKTLRQGFFSKEKA